MSYTDKRPSSRARAALRHDERDGAPALAVATHGDVPEAAVTYALEQFDRVINQVKVPVLFGRIRLLHSEDPAMERPATVEVSLDVDGRMVRAHGAARRFHEAVDLTQARLRDRLGHLADRRGQLSRGGAPTAPGEWRHGFPAGDRPAYFPRPPEDRQLLRRRAFSNGESTLADATFDMELLDQDFYLFRETGAAGDSLMVREDGRYRLQRTWTGPGPVPETGCELDSSLPPEAEVDEVIERLDLTGEPFVFFVNRRTGRGEVLYRRYDGHYGLIAPAD